MDEQYYLSEYAILSGRASRDYKDLECLKGAEPSATEEILDAEIAEKIQAYNEGQLRSFLSSDIEEADRLQTDRTLLAPLITDARAATRASPTAPIKRLSSSPAPFSRRFSSTGSPKSIMSTTSRKTFWSEIGRAAG